MSGGPDLHRLASLRAGARRRARRSPVPPAPRVPRRPHAPRGHTAPRDGHTPATTRTILTLLAVQLAAVATVAGWAAGHPLTPDHGRQQLDALTLDVRVPGVLAVAGQPTLYLAPGVGGACPGDLARFTSRPHPPTGARIVVLTPTDPRVPALGLPAATTGCHPGYALVDGAGVVRYVTYDPGYPEHAAEQNALLVALERAR